MPNASGFNALQYTGSFSLIKNNGIIKNLIELYNNKVPSLHKSLALSDYYKKQTLLPIINENFSLQMALNSPEKFNRLITDTRFQNIMMQLPYKNTVQLYDSCISAQQKLISDIDNYLK
jgi:ribonuclease HIII